MTDTPIRLRISAKSVYQRIFYDFKLYNFIDFLGYVLSGHAPSVEARARALENYCLQPHPTTRRWITGEAYPNGTATLMLYGAALALIYEGDQVKMLYDFIKWKDPSLLGCYFHGEGDCLDPLYRRRLPAKPPPKPTE